MWYYFPRMNMYIYITPRYLPMHPQEPLPDDTSADNAESNNRKRGEHFAKEGQIITSVYEKEILSVQQRSRGLWHVRPQISEAGDRSKGNL